MAFRSSVGKARVAQLGMFLAIGIVCAAAQGNIAPVLGEGRLAIKIQFRPTGIICVRSPCPRSFRPNISTDNLAKSSLALSRSALTLEGKIYPREHLSRIGLRGTKSFFDNGEPVPPEDMVTWKGWFRTFGVVTIQDGLALQPGRKPRPLEDALEISFGSPRPERISPVVLRIGKLWNAAASSGKASLEHGNCSVVLLANARQDWTRLTRSLRQQGSSQADTDPPTIYWAEFQAGRREGRRYGPGLQKLCQFDVSRIDSLRIHGKQQP